MKKVTILIADDDHRHRAMLATLLKVWGYNVAEATDGVEAVEKCLPGSGSPSPDLLLMDVRMPKKNGMDALREIKNENPELPIIIMTAYSDVAAAVEAMRNGAHDYLTKPLDFTKLEIILRNASARIELANAESPQTGQGGQKANGILGASPPMRALCDMIATVAPTEATVLITGESGTGKELAARAVHAASNRSNGPFVAINCGALTESLLASELFGHEKGAFTGADKKHPGLFVQAAGGSIFLDEIGEMPTGMQVKLLRALQEREILSVGAHKPQPINCRVLGATNRDLALEVEAGRFREDLYYRLNVVTLKMPPLRDRLEDLPELARHFARRFATANNKKFTAISRQAMSRLLAWQWPGNVRELENVMERAIILMPGEYIDERELPERILAATERDPPDNKSSGANPDSDKLAKVASSQETNLSGFDLPSPCPTLEEVERMVILQTLKRFGNNKTETARALGITRKTLHAKLNRYRESGSGNLDNQQGEP